MAAITITRPFTEYPDTTSLLVPVHLPTSMEFEFDRGAISGSYAEVVINTIVFRATKTKTVGNVDTYQINGDMLKYLLPIPSFIDYTANLILLCTVVCNGYNSAGTLIATANHSDFYLTHAINASDTDGLSNMYDTGRQSSGNIYFTRFLYYFDKATKAIIVVYNPPTGEYDTGDYSINIVNVPELTQNVMSLVWLGADGIFDRFDFTLISTNRSPKKSNPVSLYSDQLYQWSGYSLNYENEVDEEIQLRTIALNAEHYEQLYFVTQSFLIIDPQYGHIYELASPPAPIAACKQNLNFTFSLKRKIHAQSY